MKLQYCIKKLFFL